MSITSALASALTGLSAASRQAEILSSNVANATTPGYARREVQLSAYVLAGTGQGVAVTGISRDVNPYLITERRLAQAGEGDRSLRSEFLRRVESAIGTPENAGSIGARIAAFDQALIEAAARPESEARLASVASSALSLANGLNAASDDIQQARATADRKIAAEVGTLNAALGQVHQINSQLLNFTGAGHDISALLDRRQQLIDSISAIVPLREIQRDSNQIALYTSGGVSLLEGSVAEFGFTPTNTIMADMTLASGALSGLTVNGRPVDTSGSGSPVLGGRLAGLFAIRDDLAVSAQTKLDALARDVVERFARPGLDPTLAPGDPGLFTDQAAAFLPANEIGLAGRITLNGAADPAQGGALYRLRDGLQALTAGPPGNGSLLRALGSALTEARPLSSSGFIPGARSVAGLATDILSDVSARRLTADTDASFATAHLIALTDMENLQAIDTDQEMQTLIVIEKNYSANARVMQVVNDMIETLLRIG